MSKEAMKLALEALQKIYIAPEHEEYIRVWWPACEQAITALREALAEQPAQRCPLCNYQHGHAIGCKNNPVDIAINKMAENARELGLDYEPSSVSKLAREAGIRDCTCNGTKGCLDRFASLVRADERARMAEQPAQQEPIECANGCRGFVKHSPPAQRTWVGLTDEEITDIWAEASPYYHEDDFARAIEAKLRSKNEDRN